VSPAPAAGLEEPPWALPDDATTEQTLHWLRHLELTATVLARALHNRVPWPEAAARAARAARGAALGPLVHELVGLPLDSTAVSYSATAAALLLPDVVARLYALVRHPLPIPNAGRLLRTVLVSSHAASHASGRSDRLKAYRALPLSSNAKERAAVQMIRRTLTAARLIPAPRGRLITPSRQWHDARTLVTVITIYGSIYRDQRITAVSGEHGLTLAGPHAPRHPVAWATIRLVRPSGPVTGGLEEPSPSAPALRAIHDVGRALAAASTPAIYTLWRRLAHLEGLLLRPPSAPGPASARRYEIVAALTALAKPSRRLEGAVQHVVEQVSWLPLRRTLDHAVHEWVARLSNASQAVARDPAPDPEWRSRVYAVVAAMRRALDQVEALAWELQHLPPEALSEQVTGPHEEGVFALIMSPRQGLLTPRQRRWVAEMLTFWAAGAAQTTPAVVQVVAPSLWPAVAPAVRPAELPPGTWRDLVAWGPGLSAESRATLSQHQITVVETAQALREHCRVLGATPETSYWLSAADPQERRALLEAFQNVSPRMVALSDSLDIPWLARGVVAASPRGLVYTGTAEITWLGLALERLAAETPTTDPSAPSPAAGLEEDERSAVKEPTRAEIIQFLLEPKVESVTNTVERLVVTAQVDFLRAGATVRIENTETVNFTTQLLSDLVPLGVPPDQAAIQRHILDIIPGGVVKRMVQPPQNQILIQNLSEKELEQFRAAHATGLEEPPTPQEVQGVSSSWSRTLSTPRAALSRHLAALRLASKLDDSTVAAHLLAIEAIQHEFMQALSVIPRSTSDPFLGTVAHELNGALTGLAYAALPTLDGTLEQDGLAANLAAVERAQQRIEAILWELRRLDRVDLEWIGPTRLIALVASELTATVGDPSTGRKQLTESAQARVIAGWDRLRRDVAGRAAQHRTVTVIGPAAAGPMLPLLLEAPGRRLVDPTVVAHLVFWTPVGSAVAEDAERLRAHGLAVVDTLEAVEPRVPGQPVRYLFAPEDVAAAAAVTRPLRPAELVPEAERSLVLQRLLEQLFADLDEVETPSPDRQAEAAWLARALTRYYQ
ncbi:MAG: hypothetical protein HY600_03555, partial [Candidatus Omnitrophica bacterium]|nr:hypothetical protein [Candidatus Omnitrophota bacterium]